MNALRKYIKNPKIRQIMVLFQQHWGRMEIGRQSAYTVVAGEHHPVITVAAGAGTLLRGDGPTA